MRKKMLIGLIILSLFILLAFTGCSKDDNAKHVDSDSSNKIDENPKYDTKEDNIDGDNIENQVDIIMGDFAQLVSKSPTPDLLIKFMDDNIDKLSPIEGDRMIDILERTLEKNRLLYEEKLLEIDKENELMETFGQDVYFNLSNIDDLKNKELRRQVDKLYSNMYKLENIEGSFYPTIDYDKLRTYKNHISEEWKDYLMIKSLDSNDRTMSDGELNISVDELANRIFKIENYLNQYVNGYRQDEMLEIYDHKMTAYIRGLPNSPIRNHDTGKIRDEVVYSYKKASNTQGYITSQIIYEYLQVIKGNDYIVDGNILNKADELIEEALRMLREFK